MEDALLRSVMKATTDTTNNSADLRELERAAMDAIQTKGREAIDTAMQAANDMKARAVEVKDAALERGDELITALEDQIKARPLLSVGIAFGLGYFAMRLMRR